ncbi:MAG: hypothetical protein H6809_00120 [Phycisphaeraceae bacterium]|nr:hypothetical protein [Phycisphaeraceae bacterium]
MGTRMASVVGAGLVGCLAAGAFAQSAVIEVVHDDPDGVVLPGETVRVTVLASFTGGGQLAGLSGDAINAGAEGEASNLGSWYNQGALVNWGAPMGGSVVGLEIAVTPAFFGGCGFIVPQCYWNTDVHMLEFDWQAPQVGTPTHALFDFHTTPSAPGLLVFPTPWQSPHSVVLPTTFLGTSLLVVPGPGPASSLAISVSLVSRRSRRRGW